MPVLFCNFFYVQVLSGTVVNLFLRLKFINFINYMFPRYKVFSKISLKYTSILKAIRIP